MAAKRLSAPDEYARFLAEIRAHIQASQFKAAASLNEQMLRLRREFPGRKGFSRTNLFNMRQWYQAYRAFGNCPADSGLIPWFHNLLIINRISDSSIGTILCRDKDRTTVEYSLRDTSKPIGVSAYRLTTTLPEELRGSLPTIEQLETELRRSR